MSDWIGPNNYRIENYKDRNTSVALEGQNKADGTPIIMWADPTRKNGNWTFVHVGTGVSGKEEYNIIHSVAGTYLTYGESATQERLYGNLLSPQDKRTRWCIIPTRNDTGTYWIVAAANTTMKLVSRGEALTNLTALQIHGGDGKGFWWYLKIDDNATLQCPDIGRAAKPA